MTPANALINAILTVTNRKLFLAGHEAIVKLKHSQDLDIKIQTHKHIQSWNSVFSGIAVITNRITPRHRDSGGCASWYDLLLSAGTHHRSFLNLDDVNGQLSYDPGTAVLICGKVLSHSLRGWLGGERICIACFMRNMIHHRLSVFSPDWCFRGVYTRWMNDSFAFGQGWKTKC
jgi:hypothetical protein